MMTKHDAERDRIRAARWEPGAGYQEAIEMTLKNLKPRKRPSVQKRVLAVSSAAAALALFLIFAAPPIVRAAGQLYERLFGDVRQDLEDEQAKTQDERLAEQVAEIEGAYRSQDVEGASAEAGGVTMSVTSIRLTADMGGDDSSGWTRVTGDEAAAGGVADIEVCYSAIPSFDPSWVDFTLVVDGTEIPMYVDGALQSYRDGGGQTLTEDEWNDEWTTSNSENFNGTPTTFLSFKTDDWMWDEAKSLELRATIDGQEIAIPFTFDPEKAHEKAVRRAEDSLDKATAYQADQLAEIETLEANAVPVGLTGTDEGYDWAISEMSFVDGRLSFTAAFGGLGEVNSKVAAMSFWLGDVTVDGVKTGAGGSGNDAFADGNYTAIYQYPLSRDPENLPAESILTMTLEFGDQEHEKTVSFKYNWADQKVTLPADAAEMDDWTREARAAGAALYGRYAGNVGYDLTGLNLTAEKDGVTMTVTGIGYIKDSPRLEIYVSVTGDIEDSAYNWARNDTAVTIDGMVADDVGGCMNGTAIAGIYVTPTFSIAEFGGGETIVLEYPLSENDGDTLRFEFAVDADVLPALAMDE